MVAITEHEIFGCRSFLKVMEPLGQVVSIVCVFGVLNKNVLEIIGCSFLFTTGPSYLHYSPAEDMYYGIHLIFCFGEGSVEPVRIVVVAPYSESVAS